MKIFFWQLLTDFWFGNGTFQKMFRLGHWLQVFTLEFEQTNKKKAKKKKENTSHLTQMQIFSQSCKKGSNAYTKD